MNLAWTFWLGVAFLGIAVVNSMLARWLWSFPMAPDPGGPDPNGKSTAPRFWTQIHRALGLTFVAIYSVMLAAMLPRLWQYQEGPTAAALIHATLGIAIGPILFTKVLILRRWQRFGKRLPLLGFSMAALTLGLMALVSQPSAQALGLGASLSQTETMGRAAFVRDCLQCHGASTVMEEPRDRRDWEEIFEEMQEIAAKTPTARPLRPSDEPAITAYLLAIRGEDGRRRRVRGRD